MNQVERALRSVNNVTTKGIAKATKAQRDELWMASQQLAKALNKFEQSAGPKVPAKHPEMLTIGKTVYRGRCGECGHPSNALQMARRPGTAGGYKMCPICFKLSDAIPVQ